MQDSPFLSADAREWIGRADAVYVSAVSLWEISIKAAIGRLQLDSDRLEHQLGAAGFIKLPITLSHATMLRHLPALHRDPFVCMLIAQALSEPLRLLTHDAALSGYSDLVTLV